MLSDRPIITLLTDFGVQDSFVAQMKGVILSVSPDINIIDISHSISPYDIRHAAIMLGHYYRYFPEKTIHIAVVDPDVGSRVNPIIVETKRYYFIGPDNGIFSIIYRENADDLKVYRIERKQSILKRRSSTFHGRDIFSPIAVWISDGISPHEIAEYTPNFKRLHMPQPEIISGENIKGEVLYLDHFGNAGTNIDTSVIKEFSGGTDAGTLEVMFAQRHVPLKRFYSEADNGELCALINSSDHIELFINKGNASEEFSIKVGESIMITKPAVIPV